MDDEKGLIQPYGIDLKGNCFTNGCFNVMKGKKVPILLNFDGSKTVGSAILNVTDRGLEASFELFNEESLPEFEFGIGGRLEKFEFESDIRHIHSMSIEELSVVPKKPASIKRFKLDS